MTEPENNKKTTKIVDKQLANIHISDVTSFGSISGLSSYINMQASGNVITLPTSDTIFEMLNKIEIESLEDLNVEEILKKTDQRVQLEDLKKQLDIIAHMAEHHHEQTVQEHAEHNNRTAQNHDELLTKLNELKSENDYFRSQLSEINTPNKLRKYSIACGAFAFFSLGLSKLLDVNLLHPVAAYFIFSVSAIFYLMSVLMLREK